MQLVGLSGVDERPDEYNHTLWEQWRRKLSANAVKVYLYLVEKRSMGATSVDLKNARGVLKISGAAISAALEELEKRGFVSLEEA